MTTRRPRRVPDPSREPGAAQVPVRRRALSPLVLYGRSRGLPGTLALVTVVLLITAWMAPRLVWENGFKDPTARLPLITLAPLAVAAAIATGLHTHSAELDRTAARPWWRPRLLHIAGMTGAAAAGFAMAVTGNPESYGSPAAIRNLLGAVGVTLLTAALAGAGASWLPMALYSAVTFFVPQPPGIWGWLSRPGWEPGAWATAVTLFAAGTTTWALRGSRKGAA
ncbi:hypothetical protein ABZ714_31635 [Streptomyces sp. NPDC006798]|uniref:hypothetical protein n=1 Tax=Streptomyces sp. NPDC006798 TaxID=3155462 RepID=UPI0033E8A2D7